MAEPKQLKVIKGGLNIAKRLLADTEDIASTQRAQAMNEALAKLDAGKKLSKAENVAAGLYHPIGEGKKLSVPFSRMTSKTVDNPNVILHQGSIITPEQAVKERMGFFPLIGDRADTGKILTHVNGREAKYQTPLTGGGKYMQANYDPIMEKSAGWESGKGKVGTLRNRISDIAESGYQPVGVFSPGSHVQVDFNTMMPHALLGQFDPTDTSKKLIRQFDKEVKSVYPNWAGITSPEAEAQLMDKGNGVLRTAFTKTMGKDDYQSGGFPDVPSVRKAISDPDLHDTALGTLGQNMALFDPTGALVASPKHPSSYPLSMSAKNLGKLDQPENFAEFFTTANERRRLMGSDPAGDYRSFELSQPIQYADEEWLNKLMESRRLRDEAIKAGSYKKGGKVNTESLESRLKSAISKHMAGGGEVESNSLEDRLTKAIAQHNGMAGGGAAFKKLNFTEDDSPVQIGIQASKMGDNESGGVMANLDMKGAGRLGVGSNLAGRKGEMHPSTMVNYSNNVGDLGVNANVIKPMDAPNDMMMTNLMASYPIGEGRVSAGMHGNRMDGTHRVTGHSLGYNTPLGGGNLNLNVMKPKEGKPMFGAQYNRSFAEGGQAFKKIQFMADGGKLVKGIAKVGKKLMADAPTESKIAQAPSIIIPSKVSNVKETIRQSKGNYGAKRVERAADEVPNLERMYQEEALRQAFGGDNAKAMMTINPKDFEKYAMPLPMNLASDKAYFKEGARNATMRQAFDASGLTAEQWHNLNDIQKMDVFNAYNNKVSKMAVNEPMEFDQYLKHLSDLDDGFSDVPFLQINKQEQGLPLMPFISGHEGRHRSRALAGRGEEKSLVQLLPRSELREPFPRRSQEEYLEALKKELEMTGGMVRPEAEDVYGAGQIQQVIRKPIQLPDVYAKGGSVQDSLKEMQNYSVLDQGAPKQYGLSGVVLAGDSWLSGDDKTKLANQAFGQNVTNTAIGGQKTTDVLRQLNEYESQGGNFAPNTTVVLDIGGNDLATGVDRNTVRNNIDEIVSRLGAQGVNVILSGAPSVNSYEQAISSTNLAMDDLYNDVARNNPNVTVVDAVSGLLNQKGLMDDSGFHLKDDDSKLQFLNQLAGAYTGADNQGVVNIPQEIAEITQTSQPAVAESAPVRSAGYNAAMNGDGLETYYQNINNYLAQPRTQEEIQDAMQFYSVSQDDIDAARGSLDTGVMDVPASAEPSPYADGGGAFKKLQWQEPQHFDGGGMAVDLSEGEPLFTKKELETIKRNAPAVYDWAKQNVKDEASQLKTAGGMKDFALRVGAQYAGGIPDLINAGLMIPDALAGTKLASEKPWFGSEQMIDAMHKVGMLGENEFPISETLAGILAPAGLIKKGVKKGYQAYKGMKPDAPKKQRGGLAAMSR